MGKKIQVYRCDVCFITPCLQAQSFDDPTTCLLGEDYEKTDWKEAGEKELDDFFEKLQVVAELKQTPNCAVCRWNLEQSFTLNNNFDKQFKKSCCSAQGFKDFGDVYNTEECKALFDPVKVKDTLANNGVCKKCHDIIYKINEETGICVGCEGK